MCRNWVIMARREFKIAVSAMMLLLYLMVMVVSNVSVIACDCHKHHSNHKALVKHHTCSCNACQSSVFSDYFDFDIDSKCGCQHDHSNDIALYTIARSYVDDLSVRNIIIAALLYVSIGWNDIFIEKCVEQEFSRYILPPLSSVVEGCVGLRAPPSMV